MSKLVIINSSGTYTADGITAVSVGSVGAAVSIHSPDTFVLINSDGTYTFDSLNVTSVITGINAVAQNTAVTQITGTISIETFVGSIAKPSVVRIEKHILLPQVKSVGKLKKVLTTTSGQVTTKLVGVNSVNKLRSSAIWNGHIPLLEVVSTFNAVANPYAINIIAVSGGQLSQNTITCDKACAKISGSATNIVIPIIQSGNIKVFKATARGSISQAIPLSVNASVLRVSGNATISQANTMSLKASAVRVGMRSSGYITNTISLSSAVLKVKSNIIINNTTSTAIPLDADSEYPFITGNNYIVVNLRTKSHTTYRDGTRDAVAKTGLLSFGSKMNKNVSDVYMWGRATQDMQLQVKNAEQTERTYPIYFGQDGQFNLTNKKIVLAKGPTGTNWQFTVISRDSDYAEVRTIDMIVNELTRRV